MTVRDKCFIYLVRGSYDESDDIRKIFDTREKAEEYHNKMIELRNLWEKYHRDGTVDNYLKGKTSGSSNDVPECKELNKLAGITDDSMNDKFVGEIVEMNIE